MPAPGSSCSIHRLASTLRSTLTPTSRLRLISLTPSSSRTGRVLRPPSAASTSLTRNFQTMSPPGLSISTGSTPPPSSNMPLASSLSTSPTAQWQTLTAATDSSAPNGEPHINGASSATSGSPPTVNGSHAASTSPSTSTTATSTHPSPPYGIDRPPAAVSEFLETEFLIVGAGPSGASLACFLAEYGLKGIMVSAAPGTANTPRAHTTNIAALECLRDIGLDADLKQVSSEGSCLMHTRWCHSMAGAEYARLYSVTIPSGR